MGDIRIVTNKPKLLGAMRLEIRRCNYSPKTEKAFLLGWTGLMGHKDIKTTMFYTHVLSQDAQSIIKSFR